MHDGSHGPDCYGCAIKEKGLNVAPSALATRTRRPQKSKEQNNSWERGILQDDRGMPYIDTKGDYIGLHRYASERHTIDAQIRQLKSEASASTSKE